MAPDFQQNLLAVANKVRTQRDAILTEEATKNAFVMPFIATVLGYDVFNPVEVVPEFTADVGVKKGEKVDYAIMVNGEVVILIECKKSADALRIEHAGQLFRYFSVTNAWIAILTNGQVYEFYTDLDAPNKMDPKPFLVLDLLAMDEVVLPELQKLAKDEFNLDSVLSAAGELKYIGAIKRVIDGQVRDPDDEWVRFFIARTYDGSITQRIREQFRPLVGKAFQQWVSGQVNDRLKTALGSVSDIPATLPEQRDDVNDSAAPAREDLAQASPIQTTQEEIDGYTIVKAIACSEIPPHRVTQRDSKTYFAVLIDNNNRKTIARLHFNRGRKFISTFDADKTETQHTITSLDEIYQHAEAIRASARQYA